MTQIAPDNVDQERERLERIAELTDPATFRYLRKNIGVGEGWRCAEVGAGVGSVVKWLANRVGLYGRVDAVDIDTDLLDDVVAPNVRVIKQDITATKLESESYDLVHTKILLMHLPDRERVLYELAAAVKPGGWLLVEECDIRSIQRVDPPSPLLTRGAVALETFFYFMGADPGYGMKLLPAVKRTGLTIGGTDCQLTAVQVGTPEVKTVSMSLAKLAPAILKAGLMSESEIAEAFRQLEEPGDTVIYTPTTISVWAQRPPA